MGSQMNNLSSSKPSKFALQQMEKMGWKEGQGLGKDSNGITKSISVKKREDNAGLGVEKQVEESLGENWWHDAFSANLKSFASKLDKKSDKKRKRQRGEDVQENQAAPSYEDLFKATGGKRLGMRARADQPGKIKRTEGILDNSIKTEDKISIQETEDEQLVDEDRRSKEKKKKKKKDKDKKSN